MLQAAERGSQQSPDAKKGFQEYAERIRSRLETRQIISKNRIRAEVSQRTGSAQVGEAFMFFIPGPVIAALTFPGVIIHEFGHLFFCKLFKLKVYDVCFFRFGNPAGYVVHETTDNFTQLWFVSMGPFFANTILCVLFCTAAFLPVWVLKVEDLLAYFFYWLGISIGMHAFPSTGDLSNLWAVAPKRAKHGNVLAILSVPLIGLLYLLNFGRIFWADLGYGIGVGILGPLAIFRALARS